MTFKVMLQGLRAPLSYLHVLKAQGGQRGRGWDESKHPRNPAGSSRGGQFTAAAAAYAAGGTAAARERQREGMTSPRGGTSQQSVEQRNKDILDWNERYGNAGGQAGISGGGFVNRPRGIGVRSVEEAERAAADPERQKILSTLKEGSITETDAINSGANGSYKVTFEDGTEGLYKPEAQERWASSGFANADIGSTITNQDFSLAARETFAYEIADHLFPGNNPVPETVLRETVEDIELSNSDEDEVVWDDDELQQMYDSYREKAEEGARDAVGEEMYGAFQEAQQEHVDNIQQRAEELAEIWNEVVDDFPDNPAGSKSMLAQHPKLPLGSGVSFHRTDSKGVLDPIAVFDEAVVDVDSRLVEQERRRVEQVLRKRLAEGYTELGDVDPDKAREHLEYGDWIEGHMDTEMRLLDKHIKSFTAWKEENGYEGRASGISEVRNPNAPHPNGGSIQLWREADGYSSEPNPVSMANLSALDYVIGTMDRHGNNLLFHDNEPVAIDNGYSMPEPYNKGPDAFNFRSEAIDWWRRYGERQSSDVLTPDYRDHLSKRLSQQESIKALLDRHPGMNAAERKAFLGRVERLKGALTTQEGFNHLMRSIRLYGGW